MDTFKHLSRRAKNQSRCLLLQEIKGSDNYFVWQEDETQGKKALFLISTAALYNKNALTSTQKNQSSIYGDAELRFMLHSSLGQAIHLMLLF